MKKTPKSDEILNSFDGISRAKAPAFLFTRIEANLTIEKDKYLPVKPFQLAGISILMALIISINIIVISKKKLFKREEMNTSSTSIIVDDYALNTEHNLYFE